MRRNSRSNTHAMKGTTGCATFSARRGLKRRRLPDDSDAGVRQREAEDAAVRATGFQHERPTVGFGDPSRNRKTEAGSASAARWIELDEAIENPRLISGRDAGPRVGDANPDRARILAQPDRNRSASRRVLHGVLQH